MHVTGIDVTSGTMQVQFYGNHRNMTVTAPMLGINITHRFTGHVDLNDSNMGLDTFFHKDFQQEFNCMVDPQPGMGCPNRRPDMIVVNSGELCYTGMLVVRDEHARVCAEYLQTEVSREIDTLQPG